MRTIAIFQYESILQIHTINLVNVLVERSFNVHLFLYECSSVYLKSGEIILTDGHVHIARRESYHIFNRMVDRISIALFGQRIFRKTISKKAVGYSTNLLKDFKAITFIGIEKKGLAWAGFTHKNLGGKLFYYSLELYETNPGWFDRRDFAESRKLEIAFHRITQGTIIQDILRASALYKYNNFPASEIITFPISLRKNAKEIYPKSISENVTILYFGLIERRRKVDEMVDAFMRFSLQAKLRLHGPTSDFKFVDFLKDKCKDRNIEISTNLMSADEIDDVVKGADVGVCFYANEVINDRLTAFSSEKVARYLKYGVPFISFYNESYGMLFSEIKCGVMIKQFGDFEEAVKEIVDNYALYSKNAIIAFQKYYNFDLNIESVIKSFV
jgi:glycosyltransferase involved in cell wall biosynthesis